MTTPLDMARTLAQGSPGEQARGVAIVIRGLTDDTDDRQGWPLDWATAEAAAEWLGLTPTPTLITQALEQAPTLSDAILNKPPQEPGAAWFGNPTGGEDGER